MKKGRKHLAVIWLIALLCVAGAFSGTASAAGKTSKSSAAAVKNGFVTKSGRTYYFKNGKMQTGKRKIGGYRYYFHKKAENGKKKGEMAVGWTDIGKERYYFCSAKGTARGRLLTGWQKIGKKYYYFHKKTGALVKNKKVGSYYTDSKGRRTSDPTAEKMGRVDILVGDSRMMQMFRVTQKQECGSYIAKDGAGYAWFYLKSQATLEKQLKKNPDAVVIFNFGVNDVENLELYLDAYQKLIKKYPKAKIYVLSMNPIEEEKYNGRWRYNYLYLQDKMVAFNKKMKETFPTRYLDCYSYLQKEGFETVDGLHYTKATYRKIWQYILARV